MASAHNNNDNDDNDEDGMMSLGGAESMTRPVDDNDNNDDHDNATTTHLSDRKNGIVETLPPSHIMEDGRFVYLPPPNVVEKSRFFERSIAKYSLLENDMNPSDQKAISDDKKEHQQEQKEEAIEKQQKEQQQPSRDKTAPKIHPLWIASARLEGGGMNELNRAINLATLVNTNEFFTYTNVIDPRLLDDTATGGGSRGASSTAAAAAATGNGSGGTGSTSTGPSSSQVATTTTTGSSISTAIATAAQQEQDQSRQIESLFCLKRKVQQFQQSSKQLKRHHKRLKAGVYAQRVIDRRLLQLRNDWKLSLPEHGTRARLHAPRTNEVVAIDVDLYNSRDSTGSSGTTSGGSSGEYRRKISLAGRLASRVPRFATIELKDDFNVLTYQKMDRKIQRKKKNQNKRLAAQQQQQQQQQKKKTDDKLDNDGDVEMKDSEQVSDDAAEPSDKNKTVEDYESIPQVEEEEEEDMDLTKYTRAEPFAVADPNLGRVMENFDPSKIPMLNLQMEIHKSSTGFVESARLEAPNNNNNNNTVGTTNDNNTESVSGTIDKDLLTSLQHSLFCANLFESMRSELDLVDDVDQTTQVFSGSRSRSKKGSQTVAWLVSESEENFVPAPSFLIGDSDYGRGLSALSVIHCHDGEVKVQLDCEYTLCIKLVEANAEEDESRSLSSTSNQQTNSTTTMKGKSSGSQSPRQLHVLCRALLLHAQEIHHRHSIDLQTVEHASSSNLTDQNTAVGGTSNGPEPAPKASILQSCVSLGSKLLLERRVRSTLSKIRAWVQTICGDPMEVHWLPLSIFDFKSQFSIGFRTFSTDVVISSSDLTVTRIVAGRVFRKAHFRSEREFEIYLKLELKRAMGQLGTPSTT